MENLLTILGSVIFSLDFLPTETPSWSFWSSESPPWALPLGSWGSASQLPVQQSYASARLMGGPSLPCRALTLLATPPQGGSPAVRLCLFMLGHFKTCHPILCCLHELSVSSTPLLLSCSFTPCAALPICLEVLLNQPEADKPCQAFFWYECIW